MMMWMMWMAWMMRMMRMCKNNLQKHPFHLQQTHVHWFLGFLGNQPFGIVCIVYFHQQPLFHLEGPNIFHQTMVLGWSSWGRLYCPTPGFPWKITPGDVILTFPMFFFGSLFPYILPFEVINMCGGLGLGGFVLVGHLLVIASVSLGVAHAEVWLNHDHGY